MNNVTNSFLEEVCAAVLSGPLYQKEMFSEAEALGTAVIPNCGGCKCGRCPVPGSRYMFEQGGSSSKWAASCRGGGPFLGFDRPVTTW